MGLNERTQRIKTGRKKIKRKSGAAANVFFASFLDTKKEVGCGAKPHCYHLRRMSDLYNWRVITNKEASEAMLRA